MIVYDRDRLGDWALARIPFVTSWGEWYQAIGHEIDGELMAAVVFNHYSECDISIHVAAVSGSGWNSEEFLRAVFYYPFGQLGVKRVTGYVRSKAVKELRYFRSLGFKNEGLMRQALPNDDVVVIGMLASECKYYGWKIEQSAAAA